RPAARLISPDALALVRFGLRAADDPRIIDTVRAIDALLRADLPQGPVWYRYNQDGYGEHRDGRPFDGTGIGRAWPLLTGERAHIQPAAAAGRALPGAKDHLAGEILAIQSAHPDDPDRQTLARGSDGSGDGPLDAR